MNKKIIFSFIISLFGCFAVNAQDNVLPAPKQSEPILLQDGIIHDGIAPTAYTGDILFVDGKIKKISKERLSSVGARVINCTGKHIYPGLIAPATSLGLTEIAAVRATRDAEEIGSLNPEVKSIYAYNTDSKVINTLRSNGILIANIIPNGELLCGSSSTVQLDAWNWEDALIKQDVGMHIKMPGLMYRKPWWQPDAKDEDPEYVKGNLAKLDSIFHFLKQAKAYNVRHEVANLKMDAVQSLLAGKQKLFIHANSVKEMLMAIKMANELNAPLVLVGAQDAWQIPDVLKANKVAVILQNIHSLPVQADDAVDQPFATAKALQKAGIVFSTCMEEEDGFWQIRNLPFLAGTMAAYGLTQEEALQAITINAAKILGIDNRVGSLSEGKDATLIISEGDILDMRSAKVQFAFIEGRSIDLNNKQKQLFEKYKQKYGIK